MRVKNISLVAVIVTFFLLLLGAIVHNTQSSLACPDWPLCYGQVFPKMEGGVLIEHSHRLLAFFIGNLTILLVYFTNKDKKLSEKHLHLFKMSLLALFLVIAQGLLGGITVILRLPTIVSTMHLGLSLIFFSTLIYINHKSPKINYSTTNFVSESLKIKMQKSWKPFIRHGILFSMILLYSQILLGAFMRHAGAGAACGLGYDSSLLCMDINIWSRVVWPSIPQAQLHMAHRVYALVVLFAVCIFSLKAIRFFKDDKKILVLSILPIIFILFQVIIGIATVAFNISVIPTTLHLAGAALTLASLWKLNLVMRELEEGFFLTNSHSVFSDLVDLTKPRLSLLVMVTVLVGVLIAPGHIYFFKALLSFVLITLVVLGACSLNCYIEKDVDALMNRTKDRPLPAKRMKPKTALFFGLAMLIVSIPLLCIYINLATGALATLAAVLYLYAYTPLKLKSEAAVYVGAIPGAIPPVLGFTTVMGKIDLMAVSLFLILFIWQLPHFLAISIYHAEDYGAAHIKIYPNQKGLRLTILSIVIFTAILFITALVPSYVSSVSTTYTRTAFVLSLLFLLYSLKGFFIKDDIALHKTWAKNYFYGSLFYLPLLLSALIFFK
jgi:protoheme IX farnesyltransferase